MVRVVCQCDLGRHPVKGHEMRNAAPGQSETLITLRSATAAFEVADGVLLVTSDDCNGHEDAMGLLDVLRRISGGERLWTIWDARQVGLISGGDRSMVIREAGLSTAAIALIGGSPIPPRVASLFYVIQQVDAPTALFEGYEEASAWIHALRDGTITPQRDQLF